MEESRLWDLSATELHVAVKKSEDLPQRDAAGSSGREPRGPSQGPAALCIVRYF